jgi:hypothetical protein
VLEDPVDSEADVVLHDLVDVLLGTQPPADAVDHVENCYGGSAGTLDGELTGAHAGGDDVTHPTLVVAAVVGDFGPVLRGERRQLAQGDEVLDTMLGEVADVRRNSAAKRVVGDPSASSNGRLSSTGPRVMPRAIANSISSLEEKWLYRRRRACRRPSAISRMRRCDNPARRRSRRPRR